MNHSGYQDHRWRFVAYLMIGWVLAFVLALWFAHDVIETIGG